MKKMLLSMLILMLLVSTASATILPASGVDADFRDWTGIECTPAVILCQTISVYDERGDQGGKKVGTLRYTGETVPVIESWDGWAQIYYSDGNETGWVHNEYLLFDPAWYVCDAGTAVYAYPDTMAPRVGYLTKGDKHAIITEQDSGRDSWVCVSLRGASGWIRKTPADTASETWFHPEMLQSISAAMLTYEGEAVYANNAADMVTLSQLLSIVTDVGDAVAMCPFTATLKLYLRDGSEVMLELATDSCCVYRVNGRDYQYARHLWDPYEGAPDSSILLSIFGFDSWDEVLTSPGNG